MAKVSILQFFRAAAAAALALGVAVAAQSARAADPIQSQETNIAGVTADIVECKRAEGVLTLKLRFSGQVKEAFYVISGRNYDHYYLSAGTKKYLVLRDSEGTPLASPADGGGTVSAHLEKGAFTFWAKYPAPPADVTKVNIYTPLTPPFDDVPVSD